MEEMKDSLSPLKTGDCSGIVHTDMCLRSTIYYEKTCLHDFQEILKHSIQNLFEILKKCFLGTTYVVMTKACSSI